MTLTLASGPRKLDSVGFRKYCRLRFEYFRKVSAVRLKNNWQDREIFMGRMNGEYKNFHTFGPLPPYLRSAERPPSLSAFEITSLF